MASAVAATAGVATAAGAAVSSFASSATQQRVTEPPNSGHSGLDFELHDLPDISEPVTEAGDIPKIDLGGLSLDFDMQSNTTTSGGIDDFPSLGDDDGDPMARKIELAKEFLDFGDTDAARDMLHEVIEKSDGDLRAKAQAMLNKLK